MWAKLPTAAVPDLLLVWSPGGDSSEWDQGTGEDGERARRKERRLKVTVYFEMEWGRLLKNSDTAPFLSGRVIANSSGFQSQRRLLMELLNIFHPGFTKRYTFWAGADT